MNMTKTNEIQNSYGNSVTVAIANTNLDTILNAYGLPVNSIIINSEYDSESETDIGYASMVITDYEGNPSILTRHIEEKNGLHSDISNPNLIYMHIDNGIINNENNTLSLNVDNLVDNNTLIANNNKIDINVNKLDKATKGKYGVVTVDNNSIKSDNGVIHVATDKLDYAHKTIEGIAKGDENTIITKNGVLSVNAENLQKATNTKYGVVKPDNNTITSQFGVLSVNRNGVAKLDNNGLCLNKADQDSIIEHNGVISINENKLPIASNSVFGVVKLDQNSLQTDSDNILEIKDYNQTFAYIYNLEAGIDIVEQKISYIREFLDNHEYQNNIPIIRHLSCNETTTSVLAKPEAMEEPINMEIQHVYVSLNVITNCDFSIDIQYENNETPTIELDNINYNDEYSISGVEAIEHTWESTGMEEKNVILLFNCKNFFSTTGPKTKTTKLDIKVSAKEDNTKFKNIIYSIIRYNSYIEEPKPEPEPEPIYDTEFIVDENNSRWFVLEDTVTDGDNLDEVTKHLKEDGLNYYDSQIDLSAYLTDSEEKSIIKLKDLNEEAFNRFYFIGAYINVKTKESDFFVAKLNKSYFPDTTIMGKYVYEYPYKIKFDTLYYKLQYIPNILHILLDGNQQKEIKLENFKDYQKQFQFEYEVSDNVIVAPYMKFNSKIISATTTNNFTYSFTYDGVSYATIDINGTNAELTSCILKYDIKNATIYFIDSAHIPQNELNINKINLEKLYDNSYGAKLTITTGAEVYDANAYLYYLDGNNQIKDKFEYKFGLIGSNDVSLYLYANVKYDNANDTETKLSYSYSYYSLIDNEQCYIYPRTDLEYDSSNTQIFTHNIDNNENSYTYVVNYNIKVNNKNYFKNDKTTAFSIISYSDPQIDVAGITQLHNNNISFETLAKSLKFVKSINGENNANNLATHLTVSYLYRNNINGTTIEIDEHNDNPHKIVINMPSDFVSAGNSIELIGVNSNNEIHSTTKALTNNLTYEIIKDEYVIDEIVLAYVHNTNNNFDHSNLVGAFVLGCNLPEFGYAKCSPLFISEDNKFYSYYNLTSSIFGRNTINRMDVSVTSDNTNYTNMSQYSYLRYELGDVLSYTQNYLYNSYQKNGSIKLDITDYSSTNKVNLTCSNFSQKTYCGYLTNEKFVFNLGTADSISNAHISSTFVYDGNKQELQIIANGSNIYGVMDSVNLEDTQYLFLNTYGYAETGLSYYKPSLLNLNYNDNKFTITENNNQTFYDDCIKSLLFAMCNKMSPNNYNSSDMKLEIYAGNNLTYTIVPSVTNLLTIDENRTASNVLSFSGLLKSINIKTSNTLNDRGISGDEKGVSNKGTNSSGNNASTTQETILTYICNIPNLSGGLDQYCVCDVYSEYFIPRFTKPYDKYFTPYEYTIVAYDINNPNVDILNKNNSFDIAFRYEKTNNGTQLLNKPKPKTIKVKFEVKYKGNIIFEKTIDVNKETNFDGVTYLYSNYVTTGNITSSTTKTNSNKTNSNTRTTSNQNTVTTTYYAYCYYTYSTTNKYVYSGLQSYVDVNYYNNLIFNDTIKQTSFGNSSELNGDTITNKQGLTHIPLTDDVTHNLVDTHQSIIDGSVKYYLTKYDNVNDKIEYLWRMSYFNIDNNIATFNLCQYGDSKLDIVPQLKSNNNLNKITIL